MILGLFIACLNKFNVPYLHFVKNGLLLLPRNLFDMFTHVVRASVLIILLCSTRNYVEEFNRLLKWSYLYDFIFVNCMKKLHIFSIGS